VSRVTSPCNLQPPVYTHTLITIARNVDGAVKAPNSALGKFNWLMKQAEDI